MNRPFPSVRRIGIAVAVAALLATSAGCSLARAPPRDTVPESGGAVSGGLKRVAPHRSEDAAQPRSHKQDPRPCAASPRTA